VSPMSRDGLESALFEKQRPSASRGPRRHPETVLGALKSFAYGRGILRFPVCLAPALNGAVNKGHFVNLRNRRVSSEILGLRAGPQGSNAPPRDLSFKTPARLETARTCEMWGIWMAGGKAVRSSSLGRSIERRKRWLPPGTFLRVPRPGVRPFVRGLQVAMSWYCAACGSMILLRAMSPAPNSPNSEGLRCRLLPSKMRSCEPSRSAKAQ
jgi:hypothetical protein